MNDLWLNCEVVEQNKDICSGELVFSGTRVPIRTLFENLCDGACVSEFLEWFPGVTYGMVVSVLEHEIQFIKKNVA